MYDVEEYDGVLKQTSLNLDIITPVNDFEDYAFVYSKVFLNEFGINSNNRLIGASYGECYKYLKDVLFPIFKEVYQTKQKKTLHIYLQDFENYIKYVFIEIVYDDGNLLIFVNNTTDPLLKSQSDVVTCNDVYFYIKDVWDNYIWNPNVYDLLETEKHLDDYKQDILYDLIVPEDKKLYDRVINCSTDASEIIHIITQNNKKKTLKIYSKNLNNFGTVTQKAIYMIDLSDELNTEDAFLSNKLLTELDMKLGVGTIIKSSSGEYVVSDDIYDILKVPKRSVKELLTDLRKNIVNSADKILIEEFKAHSVGAIERVVEYKSPFYEKTQYLFLFLENYSDNTHEMSLMGVKDVTLDLEKEKDLEISINNQKILLKEIHHRVKNNLQIILSLINLELKFNDGDYERILKKTRNRISSMATIHQQVYNSVDFANVETLEYIALSVENLFKAYDSNIKLNLDIQSCNLHMDKAIPMGLVLNELGLNAITHAFNGGKGNFYVKFTYEDGIYALDVWDDGVGLPESVDIHKSTTL